MRIERRYTKAGAVALLHHPVPSRRQRDQESGRLGRLPADRDRGAGGVEPSRRRRAGAKIFPQGRRPGAPETRRGEQRPVLAVALGHRRGRPRGLARERAQRLRDLVQAGLRPPRRLLDLLGLEGRLFLVRGGCERLLRRVARHARPADVRAELAAMVQYRPALGLRHRRPRPRPFLRRPRHRRAHQVVVGLRAPAAACLLHPGRRGRPRQRGRHHGPVGARGAPVQIRLRHRLQLLQAARRGREAVRRRQVVRPHVVPEDRRPRRRRHQVGRHHAPRRQDGRRRRRPPGHRDLHRLEGARGAEGRRPRDRLQDLPKTSQGHHEGLPQLRGPGRGLLRSGQEPGAQARDQVRASGERAGQLHQARHPVRPAGLQGHPVRRLRHRLGQRGLSHGVGAELQQHRLHHRRLPARRRGGPRLEPDRPHRRQGDEDAAGA